MVAVLGVSGRPRPPHRGPHAMHPSHPRTRCRWPTLRRTRTTLLADNPACSPRTSALSLSAKIAPQLTTGHGTVRTLPMRSPASLAGWSEHRLLRHRLGSDCPTSTAPAEPPTPPRPVPSARSSVRLVSPCLSDRPIPTPIPAPNSGLRRAGGSRTTLQRSGSDPNNPTGKALLGERRRGRLRPKHLGTHPPVSWSAHEACRATSAHQGPTPRLSETLAGSFRARSA